MDGASAEVTKIAFSTSANAKTKAPTSVTLNHSSKRQMGRVEDYLHRISMYIGNLEKSIDCDSNQDERLSKSPPRESTDLRM